MNRRSAKEMSASSVSPYETQKGTQVWRTVNKAINDLVKNKDLIETTDRDYIVGYICEKLQRVFLKSGD
jgi:hypothetical protein